MKHNLIFFLRKNSIIVKEITENGTLNTIDVEGEKKYGYDSADDFEHFFQALKTDTLLSN